ncbi:MAG: DNA-protecting protein DprA [Chitinophagaceae bacterium]|nr:DNA-protecting protein DprA [Chitinophagaceae bacterium]
MTSDLLYQLALTMIPQIGPVQAKILLQQAEPREIFRMKKSLLEKIEGIGTVRASAINHFAGFPQAEKEIAFIEKYHIRPLFITEPQYPRRLLNCYDSPTLLFYKGEADLNVPKVVAVIGTRNHTEYGKQSTEKIIRELSSHNIHVVSGLAFGIDALAHKAAVKNKLVTTGVLAHGLDQLYPPEHTGLARDMIREGGGLLTEFRQGVKPDKHHFPSRNRIVAGMSDLTLVIETGQKGGSMITADLANGYNRDVFAIPGRINDSRSEGCNLLIQQNKAVLFTTTEELLLTMGWEERSVPRPKNQTALFIELSANEQRIMGILKEKDAVHIDEINLRSGLSSSTVAAVILNLELQNVIVSLPGKLYKLS